MAQSGRDLGARRSGRDHDPPGRDPGRGHPGRSRACLRFGGVPSGRRPPGAGDAPAGHHALGGRADADGGGGGRGRGGGPDCRHGRLGGDLGERGLHQLGRVALAGPAAAVAPGADAEVRVRVRNTGARPGREVVQAYITGAPGNAGRPVRVLGAFGGVTASPGEAAEVTLRVPARVFAVFDEESGQWCWPQGEFTMQVGRSSRDLRLSLTVRSG